MHRVDASNSQSMSNRGFEFPSDISTFDQDGDGNISKTEAVKHVKFFTETYIFRLLHCKECSYQCLIPQVSFAVRTALRERPKRFG